MKSSDSWHVIPRSQARCQNFGGTQCPHLQGRRKHFSHHLENHKLRKVIQNITFLGVTTCNCTMHRSDTAANKMHVQLHPVTV